MNALQRRWTAYLVGALLLGAASPAFSQSFPSLADETDPLTFQEEEPELPQHNEFGVGVKYDFFQDGFDKTRIFWGDFRFNDSPRMTAYVSHRLSKSAFMSLSFGKRDVEIELVDREGQPDLKLGDLQQYHIMLNFMFQGIQPFIGSGRTSDEFTLVPFGSVGFGVCYNKFDKDEAGLPGVQDLDVQEISVAAEGQVGLEARLSLIAVGAYIGHNWGLPKVGLTPVGLEEHANMHAYFGGGYLEVRF